jgi:hypothetical protein
LLFVLYRKVRKVPVAEPVASEDSYVPFAEAVPAGRPVTPADRGVRSLRNGPPPVGETAPDGTGRANGRSHANGLTNGRGGTNGRGLTNGGLTNGKGQGGGLTNGRRPHGRRSGLVNGAGRTNGNGLVNGNGLINGSGLVNGNGLINGRGLTNGRRLALDTQVPQRRRANRKRRLALGAVLLALLLTIPVFYFTLPRPGVSIDGQFGDWAAVSNRYSAGGALATPADRNVDIVRFGASPRESDLAVYVKVSGSMLKGQNGGLDLLVVFVDADQDGQGYRVNSPGGILDADLKLEVQGHDGRVDATTYSVWNGTSPDDYGGWSALGTPLAAAAGSELESSLWYSGTPLSAGSGASLLFYMRDAAGAEDWSDFSIGPSPGVLSVRQQPPVPAPGGGSLALELEAHGRGMTLESLTVQRFGASTGGMATLEGVSLRLGGTFGNQVTFTQINGTLTSGSRLLLTVNVTGVCGTFGMGITSSRSVAASSGGAPAQVSVSPFSNRLFSTAGYSAGVIAVDGAFGDWEASRGTAGFNSRLDRTGDAGSDPGVGTPGLVDRGARIPYNDPNVDLQEVAGFYPMEPTLYYYARVSGQALGGQPVPPVKRSLPGPSGTGGGPVAQPRDVGSDVLYILIDVDGDNSTGFSVVGADGRPLMGADFCALVVGKNGRVLRTASFSYRDGWREGGPAVAAAAGGQEVESSVKGLAYNGSLRSIIIAEDWTGTADRSDGALEAGGAGRDARALNVRETDISRPAIAAGSERNPLIRLELETYGGPADVAGIEIARTGTAPDRDIGAVRLFGDSDGDGRPGPSDREITAVARFAAGRATFTGNPLLTVAPGKPLALFVTVDIREDARLYTTFGARVTRVDSSSSVHLQGSDATAGALISKYGGRDSVTDKPVINEVFKSSGYLYWVEVQNPTSSYFSGYVKVTTSSGNSTQDFYIDAGSNGTADFWENWSTVSNISLYDASDSLVDGFTNLSALADDYSRARYRDSVGNPANTWYTESSPSKGSRNRLFPDADINEVAKDNGSLAWVEVYNPSDSEVFDYALAVTDSDGEHPDNLTGLSAGGFGVSDNWSLDWSNLTDISLKDADGNIVDSFSYFSGLADSSSRARYRFSNDTPAAVWYNDTSPTKGANNREKPAIVINELGKSGGDLGWVEVWNPGPTAYSDLNMTVYSTNGSSNYNINSSGNDYQVVTGLAFGWSSLTEVVLRDSEGNPVDSFAGFSALSDDYSRARYRTSGNKPMDIWYDEVNPTQGTANRQYHTAVINEVFKDSGMLGWVEVYNPLGTDLSGCYLITSYYSSGYTYQTNDSVPAAAFGYYVVWIGIPWNELVSIDLYDGSGGLLDNFTNFTGLANGNSRARFRDSGDIPLDLWYEERSPTQYSQNHLLPAVVINEYGKEGGNLSWLEVYDPPTGIPPGTHLVVFNMTDWSKLGRFNLSAPNGSYAVIEGMNLTWSQDLYMYLYDENETMRLDSFGSSYGFPDIPDNHSVARYIDVDYFPDINYKNYIEASPTKGSDNHRFPLSRFNELEKHGGNISWLELANPSWGDFSNCYLNIYNGTGARKLEFNFTMSNGSFHVLSDLGLDWSSDWTFYLNDRHDDYANYIDSFYSSGGNRLPNISNGSSFARYRPSSPGTVEYRWYIDAAPTNGSANLPFPTLRLNELGKGGGNLSWAELYNPDGITAPDCALRVYNATGAVIGAFNFSLSNSTYLIVDGIDFNWTNISRMDLFDNNSNNIDNCFLTGAARNMSDGWSYQKYVDGDGKPYPMWFLGPDPSKGARNGIRFPRMYVDEAGRAAGNLSWVEIYNPNNDSIPGCKLKVQYYNYTIYQWSSLCETARGPANQTYFEIGNISMDWSLFNQSSQTYLTLTDNNDNILNLRYVPQSIATVPDDWSFACYIGSDGLPRWDFYRDPSPTRGSANYVYPVMRVNEAGKAGGNLSWVEILHPGGGSLPPFQLRFYDLSYAIVLIYNFSVPADAYFVLEGNLSYNWTNLTYIYLYDDNDNYFDSIYGGPPDLPDNYSIAKYAGADGLPTTTKYMDPNPSKGAANRRYPAVRINELGKENGNLTWVELFSRDSLYMPNGNVTVWTYNYTTGSRAYYYSASLLNASYCVLDLSLNWSETTTIILYDDSGNWLDYLSNWPTIGPDAADNQSYARFINATGYPAAYWYYENTPSPGSDNHLLPKVVVNEYARENGTLSWVELANPTQVDASGWRLRVNYTSSGSPATLDLGVNMTAGAIQVLDNLTLDWGNVVNLTLVDQSGAAVDFQTPANISDGHSYARYLDHDGFPTDTWYDTASPTKGAANEVLKNVVINELARSEGNLSWVEIFNSSSAPATGWKLKVFYNSSGSHLSQEFNVTFANGSYATVDSIGLNWTGIEDLQLLDSGGNLRDRYWPSDMANVSENTSRARYRDYSGNPTGIWYDSANTTKGYENLMIPEFSDIAWPVLGMVAIFAVFRGTRKGRRV